MNQAGAVKLDDRLRRVSVAPDCMGDLAFGEDPRRAGVE
jgi:hypothetical protein